MLVLKIAAGIILAVVILTVVPAIVGGINEWVIQRRARPRSKWNNPELPPPDEPYQTMAEWQRANPSWRATEDREA